MTALRAYWDCLTKPILALRRPGSIAEIGVERGETTQLLLEYCERHAATLHAIDPLPQFDVAAWRQRYGERFVMHQAPSLAVLGTLPRCDLVLIDGDHNWYTVFNELKLLEQQSRD